MTISISPARYDAAGTLTHYGWNVETDPHSGQLYFSVTLPRSHPLYTVNLTSLQLVSLLDLDQRLFRGVSQGPNGVFAFLLHGPMSEGLADSVSAKLVAIRDAARYGYSGLRSFTCFACHTKVEVGDVFGVNKENFMVCAECTTSAFRKCPHCSVKFEGDVDILVLVDGYHEAWCSFCARHTMHCEHPHHEGTTRIPIGDAINATDGTVCQDCGDSLYECDSCGDSAIRLISGLCRECHSNEYGNVIQSYHSGHREGLRFFGNSKELFLGVELEVNCEEEQDGARSALRLLGKDRVHIESDGSIDSGFEIISQPHTLSEHAKMWSDFFEQMPYEISNTHQCSDVGMHVHVERKKLTPLQIGKILVFVHSDINKAFIRHVAGRGPTEYCYLTEKKLTSRNAGRYQGVNLENGETIEIRIFKSTLKMSKFMANLEFVHALVAYTANTNYSAVMDKSDFLKWFDGVRVDTSGVRVPPLRKVYPNLTSHLVSGGYLQPRKKKPETIPVKQKPLKARTTACA